MKTAEITIRSVQHYLYCPHRWGLMEIDKAWAENCYVTKANLMHERVHDPGKSYAMRDKKVFTSVPVYNDLEEYNLYGVTDCLELSRDEKGISINGSKEKYHISITEFRFGSSSSSAVPLMISTLPPLSIKLMSISLSVSEISVEGELIKTHSTSSGTDYELSKDKVSVSRLSLSKAS